MKLQLFLVLLFAACTEIYHGGYMPDRKSYSRDTTLIAYSTKCWSNQSVVFYRINGPNGTNYPNTIIDTVFYSPDYTKLIATTIHSYLSDSIDHTEDFPYKYSLYGRFVIGYRDDTDHIWKLYPWQFKMLGAYSTFDNAKHALRQSLYQDLNEYYEFYNDSTTSQKKILRNTYNIGDTNFWNSSVIWSKGLLVDGLYNFECSGNVNRYDPMPLDTNIRINYPDSILKSWR